MKKIVYTVLLLFIFPVFFVQAYTFTQTLSLGSSGQDVFELQKILNSNSQTKISETGPGSTGNETMYFGEKTKNAVIRLQNLFAQEILYPNNLIGGTGFVGKSTLELLNSKNISEQNPISFNTSSAGTQNTLEQILNNTETNTGTVSAPLFVVSKTKIKSKEIIYVGSNYKLTDIDFYIDSYKMDVSCPHSEHACQFKVSLNSGTYTLKTNDSKLGSYSLTVLDASELAPETSLKKLSLTEDNLIKGSNFTKNIKIFTMYGVFESETSNDSFILKFPENYVRNATTTFDGLFFIENDNGLQSGPRIIQYEI